MSKHAHTLIIGIGCYLLRNSSPSSSTPTTWRSWLHPWKAFKPFSMPWSFTASGGTYYWMRKKHKIRISTSVLSCLNLLLTESRLTGLSHGLILVSIFALTKTSTAALIKKSNLFIAAPMPFWESTVDLMKWWCSIYSRLTAFLSYAIEVIDVADRDEWRRLRVA